MTYSNYGAHVAAEYSRTGDATALNRLMLDTSASSVTTREIAFAAHTSAMVALANAFADLQKRGVTFARPPVTASEVSYVASGRKMPEYNRLAKDILDTFAAVKKALPGWYFTVSEGDQAPEKQHQPVGPLEVKIIAMPERETTTTVTRDGRDNIASTRQTERDVAHDQ